MDRGVGELIDRLINLMGEKNGLRDRRMVMIEEMDR